MQLITYAKHEFSSPKIRKSENLVPHINSAAYIPIALLNLRVFDVIFSLIQLSQDFIVSNGGPLNGKIPVKINRCLVEIKA